MKTEKYNITGMTCAACQANITRCVSKLNGVTDVSVSLLSNQMSVTYDETALTSAQIEAAVDKIGYGAASMERTAYGGHTSGNSGAGCEPGAAGTDGRYPPGAGGSAPGGDFRSEWQSRKQRSEAAQKEMKHRLITSIVLLIPLMYVAMGHMLGLPVPSIFIGTDNALVNALTQLLITIPILLVNRHFYQTGFKALIRRAPNMDSLVAIGSSASFLYGIFSMFRMAYGFGHGDMAVVHQYAHELYFESAAMILTLVTVGKFLEARSKAKTSDALGKLVDLAPKIAVVVRGGVEQTIPAEQVLAGDIVVIRPGESIPVDGVILEGNGYVDQAAITGESIPVEKQAGDMVISASINKNGTFCFQASRVGGDTTLAQIIRLVDEAGNTKAPIARLADKVSGIFVPIVITIAVITAAVWLIAGKPFEFALSCAIAVLVISCPCALGLATPVAIMVGTGKAAEYGILIKSAQSLELLHSIDIVLDKTGTITSGHPSVTDVLVLDKSLDTRVFLAEAAAAETGSEHPLAEAVVEKAAAFGLTLPAASDFATVPGRGVTAQVNGHLYHAGNLAYVEEIGRQAPKEDEPDKESLLIQAQQKADELASQGKTPLFFVRDGRLAGIIAVADTIRETSRSAIQNFRKMGLHVVMLTGDNKRTAEAIRAELGIEEVISDVLPTEKEACIRSLQEKGRRVAMVGDGINDAPALTRADVGIAIGAGTDIAIDSADVVLMKDSLNDVVTAIDLSRSVVRNIRMNLFWAFFYNILGIPIAAGVLYPAFELRLSPMLGSAAMSLSSVCVVTNALRLRFFKDKRTGAAIGSDAKRVKTPDTNSGMTPDAKQVSPVMAAEVTTSVQDADMDILINGCDCQPDQKGQIVMKKVLVVEGMMCGHCKMHVEKALDAVDGVSGAVVSLENKTAEVTLSKDVADDVLTAAITEAGYTVLSCETK